MAELKKPIPVGAPYAIYATTLSSFSQELASPTALIALIPLTLTYFTEDGPTELIVACRRAIDRSPISPSLLRLKSSPK